MAATMSNVNDLDQVIEHARAEVQTLLRQRAEITRRLTLLRRTIGDLARIFGRDALSAQPLTRAKAPRRNRPTGLTETCRSVLLGASEPLTTREIVKRMQSSHADLIGHHKDPIASVTSILLRLESYGEAISTVTSSRRRLWTSIKRDLANHEQLGVADQAPLLNIRQDVTPAYSSSTGAGGNTF